MTTTNPPEFYFTGIQYNPEFYVSTSTSPGITQTEGDSRYLIKTQSDSTSASAIETFNGGIRTSTIDTPTAGTLTLGGTNCTGITFSDNISSLTLANNQFITMGTNTIIPFGATQIGYSTQFSLNQTASVTLGMNNILTYTNIPAGVWLFEMTCLVPVNTNVIVSFSLTSGINDATRGSSFVASTIVTYGRLTAVIPLSSTSSVNLTGYSSPAFTMNGINTTRTRIA